KKPHKRKTQEKILQNNDHPYKRQTAQATAALADALRATLDARERARNDRERAACERLLARIAYHYGDRQAWHRAVERMFRQAALDLQAQSMAIIEASSSALLFADVATARDTVQRALDAADQDDLVYAALWLQLTEQRAGTTNDDTARQALTSVDRSSTWVGTLARWGMRELDDEALLRRATSPVERSEAVFYIAMRKQRGDEAAANQMLQQVAQSPAIDLVETHLARELALSTKARDFGPPPSPLP
ncbi:MAG: hypothetical protein MUF54_14495, partial [Polyangiaceae bacterium]|nr:hypothetical protein [Polyangiaceae bacterium]